MQDVLNISGRASFVRRFVPVFSLTLGIIIISLLLALGAMEILSAARSYVVGEGLWTKAQRDAVYALTLYAQTHETVYFERYQQALSIPLSDHRARIEMDKPDFDYIKAYAGLLGGGNHPDDVPGMVRLYRCCAEYSYFKRAVSIWKEGDAYIARLQGLGDDLHAEISSAMPSRKRIEDILEQVRAVDTGVKPLEDTFTSTLGEVVRWLKFTLTWTVSAIVSILVVLGIYLTARVMVRIRHAEEDYRLLANAIAHIADGIMILDAGRRIVAVNQAFTMITGYTPEEVVGHLFTRPQTLKIPGPTLYSIWADARTAGRWEGEVWNVRKNGELYTVRLSLSAVHDERRGKVGHYIAVFNDISPHKVHEERLKHLATHDPLTGLPNRAEFERFCREAMARARRYGHRLAVLYIDLDKFKPVNDTHGHVAGDELLRALSARMQQLMRETDIVARIGGDEFSVLLADLDDVSRSYIVACKLVDMLSQPVVSQRGTHTVGASIGISTYPDDGNDPQTLLRLADAAMYRVKQGGRSGVSFYSAPSGSRPPSSIPNSSDSDSELPAH
jgi:diguanylate cyclase (GGDEF)-like protein/PAS domain S-box-containing protein